MIEALIKLINNLGFPIVVSMYLLFKLESEIKITLLEIKKDIKTLIEKIK